MPTSMRVIRFWNHVSKTDTCWLWTGKQTDNGYGRFSKFKAHRYVLMLSKIDINGKDVHHKCNNRLCVNPDHLELILHTEHKRKKHRRDQNGA
jgi:hypothetical protein